MIRTTPQTITSHADGYSLIGGLQVLSGNPVQNYNKDTDEYEPDRTLVPLVLMPWVNTSDPENLMTGEQAITGAEWYEGAPNGTSTNRITASSEGYEISADGKPEWSLTVKKNLAPDKARELYCIFTVSNKKNGTSSRFEASIALRTTVFDSASFSLKTDRPASYTVNPLAVTPADDGSWATECNAQLYNGTEAVPDANAVYWWQKLENGAWRDFTDDEKQLYATITGRKLTIDARLVKGRESYRAVAAYRATGAEAPQQPPTGALKAGFTLNVEMPKTLRVMPVQTKGVKMNSTLTTPVRYECRLYYNRAEITGKDDLFRFTWKARSAKVGSSTVTLGTGKTIDFVPKDQGFEPTYPVEIYCEVQTYSHHALLVESNAADAALLTDGDGAALIVPVFE